MSADTRWDWLNLDFNTTMKNVKSLCVDQVLDKQVFRPEMQMHKEKNLFLDALGFQILIEDHRKKNKKKNNWALIQNVLNSGHVWWWTECWTV